jgi:hypothetical protein
MAYLLGASEIREPSGPVRSEYDTGEPAAEGQAHQCSPRGVSADDPGRAQVATTVPYGWGGVTSASSTRR